MTGYRDLPEWQEAHARLLGSETEAAELRARRDDLSEQMRRIGGRLYREVPFEVFLSEVPKETAPLAAERDEIDARLMALTSSAVMARTIRAAVDLHEIEAASEDAA